MSSATMTSTTGLDQIISENWTGETGNDNDEVLLWIHQLLDMCVSSIMAGTSQIVSRWVHRLTKNTIHVSFSPRPTSTGHPTTDVHQNTARCPRVCVITFQRRNAYGNRYRSKLHKF